MTVYSDMSAIGLPQASSNVGERLRAVVLDNGDGQKVEYKRSKKSAFECLVINTATSSP